MSGYTAEEVMEGELVGSESRFLQKPFTAADLVRTVRNMLGEE